MNIDVTVTIGEKKKPVILLREAPGLNAELSISEAWDYVDQLLEAIYEARAIRAKVES